MGLFEYVVALVIFVACMGGLITYTTTQGAFYGISPSGPITDDYQQLNKTEDLAYNLYDNIESGTIETESSDFGIVRGSVGALRQTYDAYNTTKYLAKNLQKGFSIPPLFYYAFVTIALLSIVFSIVYMVFRFRG